MTPRALLPSIFSAELLSSSLIRPSLIAARFCFSPSFKISVDEKVAPIRTFSTTLTRLDWLQPENGERKKSPKGRPRVATGGSVRGTTVVWGDYGLRLRDHDRRISAAHLRVAAETIKRRLRGSRFKMYSRICANIGVYSSGNEMRMGKGKGSFDYWASRVAVSRIVFELKGDFHEKVARDAFRLAANKLPGQYEFVKKGDPPVQGLTKLPPHITLQEMKKSAVKVLPRNVDASAAEVSDATRVSPAT